MRLCHDEREKELTSKIREEAGESPSKALLSTIPPDVGLRDVLADSTIVGFFVLSLPDNEIGDAGAESFAGVLAQCPALAHLYVRGYGTVGKGRSRASWRGQASGLVL